MKQFVQERSEYFDRAENQPFGSDHDLVAQARSDLPGAGSKVAQLYIPTVSAGGDHDDHLGQILVARADVAPGVLQGGDETASSGRVLGRGRNALVATPKALAGLGDPPPFRL